MPDLLNIPEAQSIALHICLWIANRPVEWHRSQELAADLGFSYHHFAKIVQRLVRAGILESERGPKGGIRLARPPASVSLLAVYEAAGGEPLRPHRCLLDPKICAGRACALGKLIDSQNDKLHRQMSKTTLAGLARSFDKSKLESP